MDSTLNDMGLSDHQQQQSFNSNIKLRTIEKYQLFLLCWDILCNLIIDCSASNPLTVLILFVLQCVPLFINLVLCGVSAANHALQYGIQQKNTIHYHELNLSTIVTYIILTFWWYIWTMRRLWPSVGDQFNFSQTDDDVFKNDTVTVTGLAGVAGHISDGSNANNNNWDDIGSGREYWTLWSSGFIALYTVQRTVATIYYIVYVKSIVVLLNEASELAEKAQRSIYDNPLPVPTDYSNNYGAEPGNCVNITSQPRRKPTIRTISEILMKENQNQADALQREPRSPLTISSTLHHHKVKRHEVELPQRASSPSLSTSSAKLKDRFKEQPLEYSIRKSNDRKAIEQHNDYSQQQHRLRFEQDTGNPSDFNNSDDTTGNNSPEKRKQKGRNET